MPEIALTQEFAPLSFAQQLLTSRMQPRSSALAHESHPRKEPDCMPLNGHL